MLFPLFLYVIRRLLEILSHSQAIFKTQCMVGWWDTGKYSFDCGIYGFNLYSYNCVILRDVLSHISYVLWINKLVNKKNASDTNYSHFSVSSHKRISTQVWIRLYPTFVIITLLLDENYSPSISFYTSLYIREILHFFLQILTFAA